MFVLFLYIFPFALFNFCSYSRHRRPRRRPLWSMDGPGPRGERRGEGEMFRREQEKERGERGMTGKRERERERREDEEKGEGER